MIFGGGMLDIFEMSCLICFMFSFQILTNRKYQDLLESVFTESRNIISGLRSCQNLNVGGLTVKEGS